MCGFCGQNPDFTDEFGLLDSSGNFISIIDGGPAMAGDTASIQIDGDEAFTLAVQTPEALLSSVDSDNQDESTHILGAIVEEAGEVVIERADLFGASLAFDLQAGDLIVFVEDLLATGNTVPFVPATSDFDFNDLVFVIREVALESSEIALVDSIEEGMTGTAPVETPEPSTYVLLLLGLFGMAARARSNARN